MKAMCQGLFVMTILVLAVTIPAEATAPTASFVAATTSGTSPLTVQFIDASDDSPSSWSWSFGDGNTSRLENPSHTYTAAGSYTVTLTVTNSDGSDTISKAGYITVTGTVEAPVASFVAATTSGTAPVTVQFADSSTNSPTTWVWSFGDGGTSTIQNPSHTYTSAGSYTVTLTAINEGGSSTVSQSAYIAVTDTMTTPHAAFLSAVTSGTVPLTVQFADSSANSPTAWVWSFGDGGTSTIQNPSYTYKKAGTYTVTLTASNSAGSDTISEDGYIEVIEDVPITSFTSNVTSGVVPFSVQFNDTSGNSPSSWDWTFGDAGSSDEQDPVFLFEEEGTYTVILVAGNSEGSNTTSIPSYITAHAASLPVVSFTADITKGTPPMTVQFTDKTTGSPTSWLWEFGDGELSADQNPCHTYTSAGSYTVTLTAYNAAGSATSGSSDLITVSYGNNAAMAATLSTPAQAEEIPADPSPADTTPASASAGADGTESGIADLVIPLIGAAILAVSVFALVKWAASRHGRREL